MVKDLIAACGMNCGICKAFSRERNPCPGCRRIDQTTAKTRLHCIVRDCSILKENNWLFCSDKCKEYPCKRLKALDKRYQTKYHMSMLENLDFIKEKGIEKFLEKEAEKWRCPQCGDVVTCHGGMCVACGFEKFKK